MGYLKWLISIDHFCARFFFALKPVIVNIVINIVGSKKWAKMNSKLAFLDGLPLTWRLRWTGQSRAAFERQHLTDSFYLYHSFSVIVARPLSSTIS
jgi:hypothetical protein